MKRCMPFSRNCQLNTSENITLQPIHFTGKAFVIFCFLMAAFCSVIQLNAQDQDTEYIKVITGRSAKIVNTLSICDSVAYYAVLDIMVNQYTAINGVYESYKAEKETLDKKNKGSNDYEAKKLGLEEAQQQTLQTLHKGYLDKLGIHLNTVQIEKVKDGMTYGILPLTYGAYNEMILTLKPEEKEKIYEWLKEARELAMDGESSDKKHAIFKKYKGKINNYLSANGYDLKKETEGWEQRRKSKNQ